MTKNGIHYVEKSKVSLIQISVFIERYFVHLKKCKTQKEAWLLTEQEYNEVFDMFRFSSFDSFRIVRNKYLLTKQQKNF
jgi:hypothetical protein